MLLFQHIIVIVMSLDDLMKRSVVEFPRPLPHEEVSGFFRQISEDVLPDVTDSLSYCFQQHYEITNCDVDGERHDEKAEYLRQVRVSGDFFRMPALVNFRLVHTDDDHPSFDALQFNTIPGYELDEYSPDEVQLWDDVRESIKKYFESY